MDTQEKIGWSILCIVVVLVLTSLSFCIFMPKTFNGYYLRNGQIYASRDWDADIRAFDYTPEMWQEILDNDLHLPRKK